tara:strand:- start:40138 stop:40389 length:252 start_codon:yes stop_codon:yes gene_type:complete
MEHFIYVARCADGSLYTGYATDVARRIKEHNGEGPGIGARYTSGRRPVKLVYTETFTDRSSAQKREAEIKKLNTIEKRRLIFS